MMEYKGNEIICDSCHQVIEHPEDGWVEWLTPANLATRQISNLRIVHHSKKCQFNERYEYQHNQKSISDRDLNSFRSISGHVDLLAMLSEAETQEERKSIISIIMRLFIDGYEQIREYEPSFRQGGEIDFNTPDGFPAEYEIKAMKQYMKDHPGEY